MNTEQLKQIPIVSVMTCHGFDIVRQRGDAVFYFALWRVERTLSMKVSIKNNLFIDFGDDNYRGMVIDLVMHLSHWDLQNALDWLEMFSGNIPINPIERKDISNTNMTLLASKIALSPAFIIKDISPIREKIYKAVYLRKQKYSFRNS